MEEVDVSGIVSSKDVHIKDSITCYHLTNLTSVFAGD